MIKHGPHIVEECPVCGRPVAICRAYLGRRVVCQHCGGEFVATEDGDRAPEWMEKCDRLLEAADRMLAERSERQAAPDGRPAERVASGRGRTHRCPSRGDWTAGQFPTAGHALR